VKLSGPLLAKVDQKITKELIDISKRLAKKDSTIWGENTEAETRLNWVDLPITSRDLMPQLDSLSAWARSNLLDNVLLCGMGGSSLAAEVIAATYKKELTIIDSTHPVQINNAISTELKNTVIIIGSKSGTTIETLSHLKFFTAKLNDLGLKPKDHLVIITDPHTPLDKSSREQGLKVVNADPNVGGRFSALSAFGLVPAALLGVDISVLLDDAEAIMQKFSEVDSPAVALASLLFTESKQFINLCDSNSKVPGLSDWIEQLIAESTGKNQVGRLPVVIADPSEAVSEMVIGFAKGDFDLCVEAPLGEQFILWEWVTALLCYLLKIDPFNQPNVTEAKQRTAQILKSITDKNFIQPKPILDTPDYALYTNQEISNIEDFFKIPSAYVAVMAYLSSTQDFEILNLRKAISRKFSKPATFGWGPRFLHSTGQFHKGGQPNGSFVQITSEIQEDLPIPNESFTFANLLFAQALGDASALIEREFPLIRIHLKDIKSGITKLLEIF
jgi:glucose-6-phosphate isomerase